ncbi:mycothiol synthase [Corynebacterium otitidis]
MKLAEENLYDAPDELAAAARGLLDSVRDADGVAALSEAFERGLSDPRAGHRHVLAREGNELVGLAALAPGEGPEAELAVAPGARGRGVGQALIERVGELAGAPVGFWAHGALPEARQLAEANGFKPVRELLVMELAGAALNDQLGTEPGLPDGYEVLNLPEAAGRFGREQVLSDWLAANNDAFSWHPEQGGWSQADLERAMEPEWFSDKDVLFLYEGDELAGFHWLKWHGSEPRPGGGPEAQIGEVYVIGLAAAHRGRGLSGGLLRAGLRRLGERGAESVILYVENDNEAAVRSYEHAGFEVAERHVVYRGA